MSALGVIVVFATAPSLPCPYRGWLLSSQAESLIPCFCWSLSQCGPLVATTIAALVGCEHVHAKDVVNYSKRRFVSIEVGDQCHLGTIVKIMPVLTEGITLTCADYGCRIHLSI